MINYNGKIQKTPAYLINNRAFLYGDSLFETIRYTNGILHFWEDHYFRLMAGMRILRMEIPMNFTQEYLEIQIRKTLESRELINSHARIRLQVSRTAKGKYLPKDEQISFMISTEGLNSVEISEYTVDLYKDHYINTGLLSNIKTNNRTLQVLASIYAHENNIHNCLLLNPNKHIVEATQSNVFVILQNNEIITPPLSDGCINGVMRKQVIDYLTKSSDFTIQEASIVPFELMKAKELFLTNVIRGIQPVTHYRKKTFESKWGLQLKSECH